jgi:hypothetical protein
MEQRICREVAESRFSNNRKEGIENAKVGPQDNAATDLEGFGAEFAFCKLFNCMPDFTVSVRSSKQDKGDVYVNGMYVDVKSTKYETGKLLAVKWKSENVDAFALMTGSFPTYTFRGTMLAKDLLKDERLGSLGYGKTYVATQDELKELDKL